MMPNGGPPLFTTAAPVQTKEVRDMNVRTNALAFACQVYAGQGSPADEVLAAAAAFACFIDQGHLG